SGLVLILMAVIVLKNMDSGPSGQEDPSSGNHMEQTEDTTPQPTTQERTTPASTDPPTEATAATTPAPTTEAPTEASVEDFFEGVWQGSDANVTTIEIHRDHTLYYRELNNKKIKTVEGSRGTWAAEDKKSIRITLPRLGNGYELKGTVREDGSFLLQCLNGQPWSDEIIRRSSISLEEIDRIVEERLRGMMEDGRYEFGLYPYHYTCKWEKPNEVLTVTRKEDGRYFRILPDRIETTFPFFDENYNEHNAEGVKKTVSFAKDCSYYYYELRERTDYYQNVREMQNLIKNYFDNGSDWLPILYVREGEITTFAYEAY
ncbi:MAG: hypothetical protein IKH74_03520, partial [Lachnospiraceae bacterium]|nr:hypothetical protein [Lachnospiraceae bacterium]